MNNHPHEINKEHEDELSELAAELRRLWHHVTHGVEHPPEVRGLQRQQYWVLGALAERSRRMSDLAECAQTSQASLTGIVDRLEEQGFVRRSRPEHDRRVVHVEATDAGRKALKAAHAAFVARLEHVVEPLTHEERAEFLRLVRKLSAH